MRPVLMIAVEFDGSFEGLEQNLGLSFANALVKFSEEGLHAECYGEFLDGHQYDFSFIGLGDGEDISTVWTKGGGA